MAEKIIGRTDELDLMLKIAKSEEAELLAVFGRRRVGKTFLIRNAYKKEMDQHPTFRIFTSV